MKRIFFNEVVTRDGFQMEPEFASTEAEVALIDELSPRGDSKIEVTSVPRRYRGPALLWRYALDPRR